MHLKYWQILLLEWRKNGGDGLTIPFLIGAQKYFKENSSFQNLRELIMEIALNKELELYIGYCMDINQLIVGIRTEDKLKIAGNYLVMEDGNQSNLFITKLVTNLGNNLEEIIDSLSERYERFIDYEQYSLNQNEWGAYTFKEIEFIEGCVIKADK